MPNQDASFEERWSVWLTVLSAVMLAGALSVAIWLQADQQSIAQIGPETRNALIKQYNNISHSIFIGTLLLLGGLNINAALAAPSTEQRANQSWFKKILHATKRHPAATIVLAVYATVMVHESSWFYKEILTWYDDLSTNHMLNNFSIRPSFIGESMGRNDFRFFPLSHQDLHVLSWFTPYTKVWSLVSAFELIATIVVGYKLIVLIRNKQSSQSLLLCCALLFSFTSASAYNYFQFIYSERITTFLFALFAYFYCLYQQQKDQRSGRIALLCALIAPFFKDTAILLMIVPPMATTILGSIGKLSHYPNWSECTWSSWRKAYALELAILSIAIFFLASFITLSALPSLATGVNRYDSHLRFSIFALDVRLIILLIYSAIRFWRITRGQSQANLLDSLNIAALIYGFALYALVGLNGSSYMTLPMQFVAVVDMLMIWDSLIAPKLTKKLTQQQSQALAVGATLLVLGFEDRQAGTFREQASEITQKQRSWATTFDQVDQRTREAKNKGEIVNVIFSKSWFKHSDYLRTLRYDRLIYFDIDSGSYSVVDGINKNSSYSPQRGDLLIDIDTGNKLNSSEFKINLDNYQLIYKQSPKSSYGRIFRHK